MQNHRRNLPMQKARWTTAVATAALLALPVASFAQPTQSAPPQNPQTRTQPQPMPPQPAQSPSGQGDVNVAKAHLTEARDTLSQLTSMPEAARLQGDARAQVSQLISNFNALISAQSDWRSAYNKVDGNLTSLLGPDSGDQPV